MLISYAQNFEDVMLWRALGKIPHGFYIDVGANDPTGDSVTKLFYDEGWTGINIEPLPSHFEELRRERPRDININCAVGSTNGTVDLWDCGVLGWATAAPAVISHYELQGRHGIYRKAQLTTLNDVCEKYVDGEIHFLKIDVEGLEKSVLEGIDLKRFRPWIVVVEATMPGSDEEGVPLWEPLLLTQGYNFAYADGINRFYIAVEKKELQQHFVFPPNVRDEFIRLSQYRAEVRAQSAEERAELAETASQRLDAKIRKLEEEARQLAAKSQEVEACLRQVLTSTSWRVTAPLRFLSTMFRHLRGVFH